jgi:regulator of replication initiation timing
MNDSLLKQVEHLNRLDISSREYQIALAAIKAKTSALLGETSNRVFPEYSDVEQTIIEAMNDCKNPEIEMSDYFKEYEDFLDSTAYKTIIQRNVKLHFKDYCTKRCMNFVYSKTMARVSTLRKLRSSLELFQYIVSLHFTIDELNSDIKNAMKYPSKLLIENTRLKNELDEIFTVYTVDDEEIDKYRKYKKLKADGCSDQEVARILMVSRNTLLKIVKGYV